MSFDVMHAPSEADPLLVKDGTKCGPGKVRSVPQAGRCSIKDPLVLGMISKPMAQAISRDHL